MGEFKWRELGIPYSLEGVKPPTADRVKNAKELMDTESYQDYMKTCTWIKRSLMGTSGFSDIKKA